MRRSSAHITTISCEECKIQGLPTPADAGVIPHRTDYFGACHVAMDHVRETGHELVTVMEMHTATYGPSI